MKNFRGSMTRSLQPLVLLTATLSAAAHAQSVNVSTWQYGTERTGQNTSETTLTQANVNKTHFGKICSAQLDGQVFAQPLVVTNVNFNGNGAKTVAYVVTQNDSLYAIDATNCSVLQSVVHISNQQSSASICPPGDGSSTIYNVCDLTMLGVTSSGSTYSIKDDLTATSVSDINVGMYVVGEQVTQGSGNSPIGYSRLTSSPSIVNWLVGANPPTNTPACVTGTIYSFTGSGSNPLRACQHGSGGNTWQPIPLQ
jgi:hypothetical protein